MNQSFLIFAVSSVIVPVIVGSISAYITNKIQERSEKTKQRKDRLYEKFINFYLPFIDIYNSNVWGAYDFTDFPKELQLTFFSLVVKYENKYSDENLQELIFCFRGAYHYLFSEKYIDDLQDVNHCKDELNEAFSNLYFEIYNRLLSAKKELGY